MKNVLNLSLKLFICTILVTTIMPLQAGAELPPSAYAGFQQSAGEKLDIRVIEVETSGWLRALVFKDVRVAVQAEVLRVDRSASGLLPGKTIYISYRQEKRSAGWVGPGQVPSLSKGEVRPAFLEHVEGNVYAPAAGARSFGPEQFSGYLERVYFDYDSIKIESEEARKLQNNARIILGNPDWVVRIEGHTDERGTGEYNLILGERMAQAVKAKMVELGVAPGCIQVFSYGEELPLDPAHDKGAWGRNRRVEFRVVKR
jgi:outer membrane protein OmpA-like peptidoglycan-associated protein